MALWRPKLAAVFAGTVLALAILAAPGPAAATDLHMAFAAETARPALAAGQANRWADLQRRMAERAETPDTAECLTRARAADPACREARWNAKLALAGKLDAAGRVAMVHRAVNGLPYTSDRENWRRADYWETPAEMLARGGDCEGFALTKYFALRTMGFADSDLRIAVVWDSVDREEHAILLARIAGEIWFLDNKMAEPERAADHPDRYRLIYYVNEAGLRLPAAPSVRMAEAPRIRLADGGRTLVLAVRAQPRARRDTETPLSVIERATPAGR